MVKVKVVDRPPIEADFHVSLKKEFYASYSNFQHNKKTVRESDETIFYCKSAAHGQGYISVGKILKKVLIESKQIFRFSEIHQEFLKCCL